MNNLTKMGAMEFAVLAFLIGWVNAQSDVPPSGLPGHTSSDTWQLVWSDEFDGTGINSANWTFETGGSGWGNNELEYYTNRPENATIDNGALIIVAKNESYGGKAYTSARMKTQGLQSFTYGRIEARIKLPIGQGIWPAFWTLGNSISQVGWPKCGEIDIMEHINTEQAVHGTMHWDNNGHAQYGGSVPCDVTQYHVYSIEWNAGAITWFVDGGKYWEGNITNNINSTDEFHLPFFIILNLAVGGNWPGNPTGTTPFPDTMFVDYVRVYQQTTGVRHNPDEVPDHSALLQNYPNPFNGTSNVEFRLAEASLVSLEVFDILGRKIATLVNETRPAGRYSVPFDASRLASGVYLSRLATARAPTIGISREARNLVQTRRMMLIR